jgi:hypothetical protein
VKTVDALVLVRNVGKRFSDSIRRILVQTFNNFEILEYSVVDNRSSCEVRIIGHLHNYSRLESIPRFNI